MTATQAEWARPCGTRRSSSSATFAADGCLPIRGFSPPYGGCLQPYGPLSDIGAIDPAGDWTLRIEDLAPPDGGTLHDWTLHLCN